MLILRYIFYVLYKYGKERGASWMWALSVITISLLFNVLTIWDTLNILSKWRLPDISELGMILLAISISIVAYILTVSGNRIASITNQFKSGKYSILILNIFAICYILFSLIFFYWTGSIVREHNLSMLR